MTPLLIPLLMALAGLAWAYGPLIASDPLLGRDDQHVLRHLHGFDVEPDKWLVYTPLRDVSFRLDLWARSALGLGTFHLTNLLLWCLILAVLWRILRERLPAPERRATLAWLLAAYAVHPLFVNSVGWVAARKHLLAALFLLTATWLLLRSERAQDAARRRLCRSAAVGAYLLSLLSHPIGVLWPLWALARERRLSWSVALCLPLMVIGAWINWTYYRDLYPVHVLASKFVDSAAFSPGISLLAVGRYVFNFLAPARLAAVYYPGSVWNVVGLGLVLVPVLAALSLGRRREGLSWALFFLVPLLPVTVVMTHVFVSDAYSLAGCAGLLVLIALWLEERGGRIPTWLGALAVAALALGSRHQAEAWSSDRALWERSWEVEPSPRSLSLHATQLLRDGHGDEALELAERLRYWAPGDPDLGYLYARALYASRSLGDERKLELLSRLEPPAADDPWVDYFRSAVQAGLGRFDRAWESSRRALGSPARFGEELPWVVAEATYFCRRSGGGRSGCPSVREGALALCSKAPVARSCSWSEIDFESRLKELEGS
jgi:hypothetical protein